MKKNCKIITTYFGNRRKYPKNSEESYDLFLKMLDNETSVDGGIEFDTLIVNHLCEQNSHKVIELLDSINGTETKNGKIMTMNRPYDNGEGMGFKSRDYAFQKYQDDYEYWFFVEDDANFFLDGYYKKCVDILKQKPYVAFVGTWLNSISRNYYGYHCHGSIGCTHIRFLKQLVEREGNIPYPTNVNLQKDLSSTQGEHQGEIKGTNAFLQMGYSLAFPEEDLHIYDFYYPNIENPRIIEFCNDQYAWRKDNPYNEYSEKDGFLNLKKA